MHQSSQVRMESWWVLCLFLRLPLSSLESFPRLGLENSSHLSQQLARGQSISGTIGTRRCPAVGATPCRISVSRRATLSNLILHSPASALHVVPSINTDGIPFSLSCCLILLYHAICVDLYTLGPPLVSFTAYLQPHTAMLHYFNTSVFVVIFRKHLVSPGLLLFAVFQMMFALSVAFCVNIFVVDL